MRPAALLLLVAACGGKSKAAAPPPPEPAKVATCDDVAAHLQALGESPIGGDAAEQARINCNDQPWDPPQIACVNAAASWAEAEACFPADPLCAPLLQMIAAGADGRFASLRGEPDDPDDPMDFPSTLLLIDRPCRITADDPDSWEPSSLSCEMVRSQDTAVLQQSYTELAQGLASCLPTWTPMEGENTVAFSADGEAEVRIYAVSAYFDATPTWSIYVEVVGVVPADW